jgi:DDE family transposase
VRDAVRLGEVPADQGAIKLHGLLDHDGSLPSVVVITEGNRHDVRVARTLRSEAGTVVVLDRGYVDYARFGQLTAQDVSLVTRMKDGTVYKVAERRLVPDRSAVDQACDAA